MRWFTIGLAVVMSAVSGVRQVEAAIEPGEPLDGVVDLILDVTTDGLTLSTDGMTINGYTIRSDTGIFDGEPADQLNWFFVEDTDRQISGNMGATLTGERHLGYVIGSWTIIDPFGGVIDPTTDGPDVNPYDDLTYTCTFAGMPGTFYGNLIITPEPSTLALLSMGTLALTVGWWRRRR